MERAATRKMRRQQPLCSQIDPEVEAWPSTRHLRPRMEQCRGAFRSEAFCNSKDSDFRAVLATIQKNCRRKQKVEPLCWHFRGEGHAMDDLEQLVHIAAEGDPNAFVELTRRFQHFAFGSALALLGDFQQAEDTVQEAFLAAWSSLPSLSDPAAFPGWLRGIVRHQAFRVLRRRQFEIVPIDAAENIRTERALPDDQLDQPTRPSRPGCYCETPGTPSGAGDTVLRP